MQFELVEGKEEALKVLRDLKQKFGRGEITCATMHLQARRHLGRPGDRRRRT